MSGYEVYIEDAIQRTPSDVWGVNPPKLDPRTMSVFTDLMRKLGTLSFGKIDAAVGLDFNRTGPGWDFEYLGQRLLTRATDYMQKRGSDTLTPFDLYVVIEQNPFTANDNLIDMFFESSPPQYLLGDQFKDASITEDEVKKILSQYVNIPPEHNYIPMLVYAYIKRIERKLKLAGTQEYLQQLSQSIPVGDIPGAVLRNIDAKLVSVIAAALKSNSLDHYGVLSAINQNPYFPLLAQFI